MIELRPLSPLNTNYDPPRPWTCQTPAGHDCAGPVVGAVGAYPVCQAGAGAEITRRHAEDARLAALWEDPEFRAAIAAEAAVERWIESR